MLYYTILNDVANDALSETPCTYMLDIYTYTANDFDQHNIRHRRNWKFAGRTFARFLMFDTHDGSTFLIHSIFSVVTILLIQRIDYPVCNIDMMSGITMDFTHWLGRRNSSCHHKIKFLRIFEP